MIYRGDTHEHWTWRSFIHWDDLCTLIVFIFLCILRHQCGDLQVFTQIVTTPLQGSCMNVKLQVFKTGPKVKLQLLAAKQTTSTFLTGQALRKHCNLNSGRIESDRLAISVIIVTQVSFHGAICVIAVGPAIHELKWLDATWRTDGDGVGTLRIQSTKLQDKNMALKWRFPYRLPCMFKECMQRAVRMLWELHCNLSSGVLQAAPHQKKNSCILYYI